MLNYFYTHFVNVYTQIITHILVLHIFSYFTLLVDMLFSFVTVGLVEWLGCGKDMFLQHNEIKTAISNFCIFPLCCNFKN